MIKFGTDGLRGRYREELSTNIAYKLGEYLGYYHRGKKIVVGQDTRLSSDILAYSLATGAASQGVDVYMIGVCPTPALAYISSRSDFAAGVMVSASHNPYYDNGLKVFNDEGKKITKDLETQISQYLLNDINIVDVDESKLGQIYSYSDGIESYIKHIENFSQSSLKGMKIVLDCANGASVVTAENIFKDLGAEVYVYENSPNGININHECGSTHLENLQKLVLKHNADVGFAFDGDADRCLAVDNHGNPVDGDMIMFVLANDMKNKNELKDNTIVLTVMSNLGVLKAFDRKGIHYKITDVGDKNVFACMDKYDYKLGGEQSGHVIIKDFATTGDGVLTALKLAEIIHQDDRKFSDIVLECQKYPQVLEKVTVQDKEGMMNNPVIQAKIKEIEQRLGETGRILVRASGTEPVIRVMVEAKDIDLCESYVSDMIRVIKEI